MATIISIEAAKRGTSQVRVETNNGDIFIIGFSSTIPVQDSQYYSSLICSIVDDYCKDPAGDMFSYISLQMARAKMEMPLFLMPDRNDERTRIGKKIRSIREEKNMGAKVLARLTDIDPANLSRIETGKFSAGLDTLCRIAMALEAKVDIVPNTPFRSKGFNMNRNIWVLPTGDYNPIGPIPPYGCIYWPRTGNQDVRIGDIVATYYNERKDYIKCFIVSETYVTRDNFIPELPDCYAQTPDNEASSYFKINSDTGLSSTEENIIFHHAMQQIPGGPVELTLLEGDIL